MKRQKRSGRDKQLQKSLEGGVGDEERLQKEYSSKEEKPEGHQVRIMASWVPWPAKDSRAFPRVMHCFL